MKTYLDFRFDVTGLTPEEIGNLALSVSVQAEARDEGDENDYPTVPYPTSELNEVPDEPEP